MKNKSSLCPLPFCRLDTKPIRTREAPFRPVDHEIALQPRPKYTEDEPAASESDKVPALPPPTTKPKGKRFKNDRRARAFMVTVQHGKDSKLAMEQWGILHNLQKTNPRYLVWQQERGTETMHEHYQVYIMFHNPVAFSTVKRLMPQQSHIEEAKKPPQACIKYCTKTATRLQGPWEFGEEPQQGIRTDLNDLKLLIDSGAGELDIAAHNFGAYIRNTRAFRDYMLLVQVQRTWQTVCIALIGATGVGKSRFVHDFGGNYNLEVWVKPALEWCDGYRGQPIGLFDDFYGSKSKFSTDLFLKITDRYKFIAPVLRMIASITYSPLHLSLFLADKRRTRQLDPASSILHVKRTRRKLVDAPRTRSRRRKTAIARNRHGRYSVQLPRLTQEDNRPSSNEVQPSERLADSNDERAVQRVEIQRPFDGSLTRLAHQYGANHFSITTETDTNSKPRCITLRFGRSDADWFTTNPFFSNTHSPTAIRNPTLYLARTTPRTCEDDPVYPGRQEGSLSNIFNPNATEDGPNANPKTMEEDFFF